MAKLLSDDVRHAFRQQGIAYPIRVMSELQAAAYRQQCDRLEADLGGKPRTVEVRQMHLHFAWAYRLATEKRVLDAVEDLLGENLLIWATELFTKHPNDRAVSIGWHRDGPYMGLDPERTVTAWIALSPSNLDNGCMRFAHEEDRKRKPNVTPRDERPAKTGLESRKAPDAETSAVILEPGEMSLHDVYVLHGSDPNQGGVKRVGFAVRFTTPEARPAVDRPPAVLARGRDHFGYFDLQPAPTNDEQDALVQMRQSARRHLDATLRNLQHAKR